MKQHFFSSLVFLLSSIYILILDNYALSPNVLQRSLAFPLIIILIVIYFSFTAKEKIKINKRRKWYLLFLGSICVQLLVVSTGNINSPFLILIHFAMIYI